MKQDTKNIVLIGGAALAALYAYSTMGGEDYTGMGGGGGAPLLPAIVEAATGAETAAPMLVNIPPMPMPIWDTEETVDTSVAKKIASEPTYAPSLIPTYPLEYYKAGGVSELSLAATQPQELKSVMELQHYADPLAYLFSGRTDKIQSKKPRDVKPDIHKTLSVKGHQEASLRFDPKKSGGYSARSGDAFTRLGQRSYSGARSAALSSSKKAQRKPGSAD